MIIIKWYSDSLWYAYFWTYTESDKPAACGLRPAAFSLHLPASRASIRLLQACMCLWHLQARGPAEGIRRACGGPAEGLWRACRTQVQCLRRACAGPAEGLWVSRAIYGTVVLGGLNAKLPSHNDELEVAGGRMEY